MISSTALSRELEDVDFFKEYSTVRALCSEPTYPNSALETYLKDASKLRKRIASLSAERFASNHLLAFAHSTLALVLWLHPNHPKFRMLENSQTIFQYANLATDLLAPEKWGLSDSAALGFMLQLRVLPYLIEAKKNQAKELVNLRERVCAIIESAMKDPGLLQGSDLCGRIGLCCEGLGYSFYQFEHDTSTAQHYFHKAIEMLSGNARKDNHHFLPEARSSRRRTTQSTSGLRAKQQFYSGMSALAHFDLALSFETLAEGSEGDTMVAFYKSAEEEHAQALELAKLSPWVIYRGFSAYSLSAILAKRSEFELDPQRAKQLLNRALSHGERSLRWLSYWSTYERDLLGGSWTATLYQKMASYRSVSEGRKLMSRSISLAKRAVEIANRGKSRYDEAQIGDVYYRNALYQLQVASDKRPQHDSPPKVDFETNSLETALSNCYQSLKFYQINCDSQKAEVYILAANICHRLMNCPLSEFKRTHYGRIALRFCNNADILGRRHAWMIRRADAEFLVAQILDRKGKFSQSASKYLSASEKYEEAGRSTQQSKAFGDLVNFALAWHNLELAKISHKNGELDAASSYYEKASELVSQTIRWKNRFHIYLAESYIERAEELSLQEKAKPSVKEFENARAGLKSFLAKSNDGPFAKSYESVELVETLLDFCRARISLENSKIHHKAGNWELSIKELSKAKEIFSRLSSSAEANDPAQSEEFRAMASLCKALGSFQLAQSGKSSFELYTAAEKMFEKAAENTQSKSLKCLLSGFSNLSSFLCNSKKLEESLDESFDVELSVYCDLALSRAVANFKRIGNGSLVNTAKASKRLLDAMVAIKAAEREAERPEVKATLFSEARKSLILASRYFSLIGSKEKSIELAKLIEEVSVQRNMTPHVSDIMADLTSNQMIYGALANSSIVAEKSGDSTFRSTTGYLDLEIGLDRNYLCIAEIATMTFTISNLGREPAVAVRLDDLIPDNFVVERSTYPVSSEGSIKLNRKIAGLSSERFTIEIRAQSPGDTLNVPTLVYLDSLRKYAMTKSENQRIAVEKSIPDAESILSERSRLVAEIEKSLSAGSPISADGSHGLTTVASVGDDIIKKRERLQSIDEEFLRAQNECSRLEVELAEVRSDQAAMRAGGQEKVSLAREIKDLEVREQLLTKKLERRQKLLLAGQLFEKLPN